MKKFRFVLAGLFCLGLNFSPMSGNAQGCTSCSGTGAECYRIMTPEGPHIFYGEKKECPVQ